MNSRTAFVIVIAACGCGGMSAGAGGGRGGAGARGGASSHGANGGATAAASSGNAGGGSGGAGAVSAGAGNAGSAGGGSLDTGGPDGALNVSVNLDELEQKMAGFGVSDEWCVDYTASDADALFDATAGIGVSILRIGMDITGDAIGGTNCWDDIKAARVRGVSTFIASVPSAPASCKSNNNIDDGGYLLAMCFDSWAATVAAFPAEVQQNSGVDLYALSPADAPDFASCGTAKPCDGDYPTMLFTADELVAFVKAVGPKLRAASPGVRLMTPDTYEWIHLWSNMSAAGSSDPLQGMGYDYGHALHADTVAWDLIDVLSTHQYDTQIAAPWPNDVPMDKPIWMTEMAGIKWWPEEGPSTDIDNGIAVAGWIHDAIVNGLASAWLYWSYRSTSNDDNTGLLLKTGPAAKRFYTFGNFSKFVRPGYVRVNVTGPVPPKVLLTGYQGGDGTVVVVAINQDVTATTLPISISGGVAPASLTPWVTSATDNLTQKTVVPVDGGTFVATLAAKTVTTFVGK